MTIKFLFLGALDNHEADFLPFLSRHGYDVTVINTSNWSFPRKIIGTGIPVYNLYENTKIRFLFNGRMGWFGKAAFYSLAEKARFTHSKVKEVIKQEGIEVIYGSWGSHSLPELRSVQEFNVPIVYEFLTYPTNVLSFAVKTENVLNRSIMNRLDGRVLATQRMLDYMKNVFGIHYGQNLVFTECYSERFFYRRRLPRLSEHDDGPHVIFTGSDVYEVLPQIEEIMRRGIHVYVYQMKGFEQRLQGLKSKGFGHTFKKFDYNKLLDGTFATFMTQFDACLVTYDFRRASTLDRFYNSIPDRFSFALTAGIPIVMPRGYLKGCEEILNKHQIGFTYAGYDDLKNKLNKNDLMDYYRNNAFVKSKFFTLENNFGRIDKFLRNTCLYHKIKRGD